MNGLFNDFCALSGHIFDPNFVEPGREDANKTTTIPDLTAIPLAVLKTHIIELENEANLPHKGEHIHSGPNFKKFCAHFSKLQQDTRAVAFVGQSAAGSK